MKTCRTTLLALLLGLAAHASDTDTIVFVREATDSRGLPNMILEKIQADGSGRAAIFNSEVHENREPIPYPKWQRSPDVSPLGKQIVLRRSWTVSVMNWDGSGGVNVTPYRREWYDPAWSPDGRRIALCADARDFAEIMVMNHDGSGLRNLTWKGRSNERSPDWSPDGSKILFISDRGGKFELYTMDADNGLNQTRILSLDGDIREPVWGPHGRIAFSLQKDDGNAALYSVGPHGSDLKELTAGDCWDGQASWDAEGKRLAFVSNRSGTADIWVMNMATGRTHNVTRNSDNSELFPAWVPRQLAEQAPTIPAKDGTATNIAGLALPRPRLLFRAEDISAIRKTFSGEPHAAVWKKFLANSEALLDPKSRTAQRVETAIEAIKDNPSRGYYDRSPWITPVFNLAFARQITSERRYGERAAAWLMRVAAEYAKWHQNMVTEPPVACSYDWLYDLFEPDDLRMLTGLLQTGARRSYKHLVDYYFGETNSISGNYAAHTASSVGPLYLALSGETGSSAEWLAAAVRLITINLNTWIGPSGDAAEGTSYFNAPVGSLMPFLVSLKINDLHRETRNSNLRKFADWYAVVNAGGLLPSIGDSDGGRINFPVGLLQLYPGNETARKLWNSVARPEAPSPNVLSLLWFEPSENRPQDFSGHPRTAYFDAQNYQVFRTGYGKDSLVLTFTLTAGGHAHAECGAIALTGFGQKLLVDPGQAVNPADCHSQLLINGQGRYLNYRSASGARERISPIQTQGLAGASVNMVPAYASREVSTHRGPPYGIAGPGMKLDRGSRTVIMVGDDASRVPPYYLLYDDVRLDGREALYEQLFIGNADMVAEPEGEGAFVYRKRYAGPWLAPAAGGKGSAAFELGIRQAGKYQPCVLMTRNPASRRTGTVVFRCGDMTIHAQAAYRSNRADCWQWAPVVFGDSGRVDWTATRNRTSGEPIVSTVALPAGTQSLLLFPKNTVVAGVALVPEDQAKDFSGWGALPEGSSTCMAAAATINGNGWSLGRPERPPAELLVSSLNNEPAAFALETFSFNTRFHNRQFITLPRAKLVKRQPEANFLTLLYARLPDMELPRIQRRKDGAVITWKHATDNISTSPEEILVRRHHRGEDRQELFRYRRPAF